MYSVGGLQKVCDILLEYPSWSIAHLIAHFNLTEYINNPKVQDLIDEPDYETQMTPIQVSYCLHIIANFQLNHTVYRFCGFLSLSLSVNPIMKIQ